MKSGRKEHEMKMTPPRHKAGGKVVEDERTKEMVAREEDGQKRGGMVKGKAPKARADKRARGGRMTPKSPMTSAANVSHMPYEGQLSQNDTGGKGKDTQPRP